MFMYSNSYILNHTGLRDYLASSNIVVRYVRDKAPSSVNDVASWTRIQLGTSPLAAFFATTLVYCECLDLLSEKHAIYVFTSSNISLHHVYQVVMQSVIPGQQH